jgi:hypothetical protein
MLNLRGQTNGILAVSRIVLPGQNVAIQTAQNQIEPVWYEKLKGWESWINLVSAIFPSGPATPTTPATLLTASLGADVALNNTGIFFNGPSIAQGTTGTWFASGTVTLIDTGSAANFLAMLWDGTKVIASTEVNSNAANVVRTISLSGYIASPTGNIRISCADITAVTGKILFNQTGQLKDSTISAFRIA